MYLKWFKEGEEPTDMEAKGVLRKNANKYNLIQGILYREGFSMSLLRCVDELEKVRIVQDVHEGLCGNHIEGRSLIVKILRVVFYGPN